MRDINELIWPELNKTGAPITLKTSKGNDYVINPGERIILPKQVEFLKSMMQYDAVLFGGAAGPGKSYALRWAIINFIIWCSMPTKYGGLGLKGVEGGLFCESYTTLQDRQIGGFKKLPSWLGKYYEKAREFRINEKLGGGIVKLRNLDDPTKYSSAEFAIIAIDELTFNPEPVFNFLRTRRRWPPIEHCPLIAATNPGNIGHAWVYKRFVDPATRVKPHYDEELDYWSKGYHFIQALPSDNPFLPKQYRADLKTQNEKLRRALSEGDWSTFEGQYFNLDPFIHQVADFEIPEHWSKFRAIDNGLVHPFVCVWGATDEDGNLYIYREYSAVGKHTEHHKNEIVQRSLGENYKVTVADPAMFSKQSSSMSNKLPFEVLNDTGDGLGSLKVVPANNDRVAGWQALQNGFSWEGKYTISKEGQPVVHMSKAPKIFVFKSCVNTWNSLTKIIHDDVRVEDVKKSRGTYGPGEGDDEAEAVRYLNLAVRPTSRSTLKKATGTKSMRAIMRDYASPWEEMRGQVRNVYAKF